MSETLAEAVSRGIQRRMLARMRYRRRRDRKIAIDLIGRIFEQRYTRPLDGVVEWNRMMLTTYNPETSMVHFWMELHGGSHSQRVSMSTDDFWSQYTHGTLRDA